MARKKKAPSPKPPSPKLRRDAKKGVPGRTRGKKKKEKFFGGYKMQNLEEFEKHTEEVKTLARGKDIVEGLTSKAEQRPPAFDRQELQVVRSWLQRRPLEPTHPAAAMIAYPRMWTTKRGRYCKFRAPGGRGLRLDSFSAQFLSSSALLTRFG